MRARHRFALVTAALCGSVLLVELSCRAYLFLLPRPYEPSWEEQAANPPPPYQQSDYYSLEFLLEQDSLFPRVFMPPGAEYPRLPDVSGRFFNVSGGLRVTTDQPRAPSRRVFVFGGSSIFAHEVPDRYTVPSVIQRSINASCPEPIAAFNYGIPGMWATHQAAWLKSVALRHGDVVVFVDGYNDVFGAVTAGTSGSRDESAAQERYREWAYWIHATADRWRGASALAEVVARAGDRTLRGAISDPVALGDELSVARKGYRGALLAAQRHSDAAGARFLHFLQPHLFATALTTAYRRQLADDWEGMMGPAFHTAYSALAETIAEARTQGVRSVDLSRVFEPTALPDEVFLDYVHVNHKGNEILAAAMFREVGPALGCLPYTSPRD